MQNKLSQRFDELAEQLKVVQASKKQGHDSYSGIATLEVDSKLFDTWKVKAQHLIAIACGEPSQHFKAFVDATGEHFYSEKWTVLERMTAVFEAAKEDYQGGYCSTLRSLVQAEIFNSELEQSTELLSKGYKSSAAVVAGTVLETALRELCDSSNLPYAKLDKMNADLVKASVYNVTVQKRITALADVRNNAAHGHPEQFTDGDVKGMIEEIERFLSQHLA